MISFSQPYAIFRVVFIASFVVFALFGHARHRCPHRDPLCRPNRPCIGCYRTLFSHVKTKEQ